MEIVLDLEGDAIVMLDGLCNFLGKSKEEVVKLGLTALSSQCIVMDAREEKRKAAKSDS